MRKIHVASFGRDPRGTLVDQLLRVIDIIMEVFCGGASLVVSPDTMRAYRDAQVSAAVPLLEGPGHQADRLRAALTLSLTRCQPDTEGVLLIDFDRLLHWADRDPIELRRLSQQIAGRDFSFFCRLPSPLSSHPWIQLVTEQLVNNYVSDRLNANVDCLSGAFGMSRSFLSCLRISEQEFGKGSEAYTAFLGHAMTHCRRSEWQTIMVRNGLEWETPSQFLAEIEEEGYTTWMRNFQRDEYKRRVEFAYRWIDAFDISYQLAEN